MPSAVLQTHMSAAKAKAPRQESGSDMLYRKAWRMFDAMYGKVSAGFGRPVLLCDHSPRSTASAGSYFARLCCNRPTMLRS